MINFSLKHKTAIITGASRGIGAAISIALSSFGAHCILISRSLEGLKNTENEIKKSGGSAESIECHMGYPKQIESLSENINNHYGKVDILINNAGTNPYFGEMIDADERIWDKTNDVNLKGPFFMIKHFVPLIISAGGGSIVNIASVNGVSPPPMQGIYSITKAGIISMTKGFAKELAKKNIRVNAVLPGLTDTKLTKVVMDNEKMKKQFLQNIPMGRNATPMEIAGAVVYLVSEASSYTTGTCIVCDGGMLA